MNGDESTGKVDPDPVIRLRVDAEFKAEVEALARSRKISVSALVRQKLVDAVEEHRAKAAVIPDEASADADMGHRVVVPATDGGDDQGGRRAA